MTQPKKQKCVEVSYTFHFVIPEDKAGEAEDAYEFVSGSIANEIDNGLLDSMNEEIGFSILGTSTSKKFKVSKPFNI